MSTHLGEHLTNEYAQNVNPFKKIPAIVTNDFKLSESVAIYRYLAKEYKIDDAWYPKDIHKRARVDEYLEWQHVSFAKATYCWGGHVDRHFIRHAGTHHILTILHTNKFTT